MLPDPEPGEHPRFERFVEVAREVERETGKREDTEAQVRRSLLVRAGIVLAGSIVCLLGLAMMVLPGPGLPVLLVGLLILSPEVPFAARMVDKVRARLPEGGDGKIAWWVWALGGVGFAVSITIGLWFAFWR